MRKKPKMINYKVLNGHYTGTSQMATKWSFISHFIYKHSHKIARREKKGKILELL